MTENLTTWVDEGRAAAKDSGKSAAKATACCYLVYRVSFGADAEQSALRDFKTAIEKAAQDAKIENARLDAARELGKRLSRGWKIENVEFKNLPDDHPRKKEARELFDLSKKVFDGRKKVELDYATEGDEVVSLVVRYTTGFFFSNERSSVSLYKTATQWLDDKFKTTPPAELGIDALTSAIEVAGGFAKVVAKQREKSEEKSRAAQRDVKPIKIELADDVKPVEGDVWIKGKYTDATKTLKVASWVIASETSGGLAPAFGAAPDFVNSPQSTPARSKQADNVSTRHVPEPA